MEADLGGYDFRGDPDIAFDVMVSASEDCRAARALLGDLALPDDIGGVEPATAPLPEEKPQNRVVRMPKRHMETLGKYLHSTVLIPQRVWDSLTPGQRERAMGKDLAGYDFGGRPDAVIDVIADPGGTTMENLFGAKRVRKMLSMDT